MGNQESTSDVRVILHNDSETWKIERVEDDSAVCHFTSVKEHEKCREGVKILRTLRHPNILKFLSSYSTPHGYISMYTELVYPLQSSLPSQKLEGVVRGWRDVGRGLDFIHTKLSMSHNNLHIGCVFVGGVDSKWKLGGFELTAKHSQCTKQFFTSVSKIRHSDAIPPEDEEDSEGGIAKNTVHVPAQPIHARDVWAFANLMLQTIEDIDSEDEIHDEMVYYVNNEMLNHSPGLRPTVSEVLKQFWMNNKTTSIIDFLTNLTLKPQPEKDEFFRSLPHKLHSIPAVTLAEHIVPLLLSPLVMAEPMASDTLWQHLLCPVSLQYPRNIEFNPTNVNPLLEEDQFRSHVLPLLLNLMESREYHVRLILLHNLHLFCHICSKDDLANTLLPEVLVGLNDSHDDVVASTLRALADLIPLVGSAVVMGTTRKNVFADTRPKIEAITGHVYNLSEVRKTESLLLYNDKKEKPSTSGKVSPKTEDKLQTVSDLMQPLQKTIVKKYSPSASNDESTSDHEPSARHESNSNEEDIVVTDNDSWEDGFERFDNNEFDTNWGKWGNEEHDDNDESNSEIVETDKMTDMATTKTNEYKSKSAMSLINKKKTDQDDQSTTKNSNSVRDTLKGQLSEEDIKRLEEKAEWSMPTVNLFADMAPKISKTVRVTITDDDTVTNGSNTSAIEPVNTIADVKRSSSLQMDYSYVPPESDVEKGAWGDDWNNIDDV